MRKQIEQAIESTRVEIMLAGAGIAEWEAGVHAEAEPFREIAEVKLGAYRQRKTNLEARLAFLEGELAKLGETP